MPSTRHPITDRPGFSHHPAQGTRRQLSTDLLVDIATGLATSFEAGALAAPPTPPAGLLRERVLAATGYDVWVHSWAPGAVAEEHDHDGSVVVVLVLDGNLTEDLTCVGDHATVTELLNRGSITELDALTAHQLANPFSSPAVSIHVYSPPVGDGTHR